MPHRSMQAVATVLERAGSIDIVVNNAGVELFGAVHLVSDTEVARQLDTNVTGVVRVVRAVVPHMVAAGRGAIVNVGSVAGRVGVPYSGLYAASKHAVEALTEAMHFELAQHGIRVSVVEPGQFATELAAKSVVASAMGEDTAEYERWQAFRTAMRQLVHGEPADPQRVADVILEAATSDAPRLRWPVGDDAALVLDTKAAMTFEDFETTMRTALDWHD
jgi:NAD(P)-dependent dehydrogenase (short-subunit alcohol dehydrogenase family)